MVVLRKHSLYLLPLFDGANLLPQSYLESEYLVSITNLALAVSSRAGVLQPSIAAFSFSFDDQ
jgi:hypothetical protein